MREKVYEVLGSWARVPTWHTGHPVDQKRLHEAVAMLADAVGTDINEDDIRSALRRYRAENVELLGGKASDEKLESCVQQTLQVLRALG